MEDNASPPGVRMLRRFSLTSHFWACRRPWRGHFRVPAVSIFARTARLPAPTPPRVIANRPLPTQRWRPFAASIALLFTLSVGGFPGLDLAPQRLHAQGTGPSRAGSAPTKSAATGSKSGSRTSPKGRSTRSTSGISADVSGPIGVYTSRQIELHTDLDREAAEELVERLENELALIGKYWGRAASGVFEMYVVADLSKWPRGLLAGEGLAHIESGGGVTIGQTRTDGTNFVAKARVYAVADRGTPQHELVHAYCVQTFGRVGPVWYAEGMAEMGQYWRGEDRSVLASRPVVQYLRESPLVPLKEIVHGDQKTGDSWKNYAWRWALCHLLANNPNYAPRFRPLGVALLTGQRTGFDNVYGSLLPEIEFEYREFLQHLDEGLRVDLTAWNWQAKFKALSGRSTTKARVEAARGWQPSRLTLEAGDRLSYACSGQWMLGQEADAVDAGGGPAGQGRLWGVMLRDEGDEYQLGEPFQLGASGEFSAPTSGRLYLRCHDRWTELADNTGFVTVELKAASPARPDESPDEMPDPGPASDPLSQPAAAPTEPDGETPDTSVDTPGDAEPTSGLPPLKPGRTPSRAGAKPGRPAPRPPRERPPRPGVPGDPPARKPPPQPVSPG